MPVACYRVAGGFFGVAGFGSMLATALRFAGVAGFAAILATGRAVRTAAGVTGLAAGFLVWLVGGTVCVASLAPAVVLGFAAGGATGCFAACFGAGAAGFTPGLIVLARATASAGLFTGGAAGLARGLMTGDLVAGMAGFAPRFVAMRGRGGGSGFTAAFLPGARTAARGGAVAAGGAGSAAAVTELGALCDGATSGLRGDSSSMMVAITIPVAIAEVPIVIQLRGMRGRGASG
jgi:hypothetical protein